MEQPDLSIVIPGKNEREQIDPLFADLVPILENLGLKWEILFVDDGSTDDSVPHLLTLREADKRIAVLALSRNFGKEIALSAGLHHARGNAVISMDADGQHQPSLIPQLVQFWQEGFDMVTAQRIERAAEGWMRALTASLFYRIFNWVSDVHLTPHAGDFRLFDRKVIEAYKKFSEHNRFNKGLFALLGFKQKIISHPSEDKKNTRATKWGWGKLFGLAFNALFSFSKLPLRLWMGLGFLSILFSLGFLIYIITGIVLYGKEVPGYASLLTAVVMMGGVNMVGVGILGEYITRTFIETKRRPLYLIREHHQGE